jgi:hypothetical protein
MLTVLKDEAGEFMIRETKETKTQGAGGKKGEVVVIKEIHVRPSFVWALASWTWHQRDCAYAYCALLLLL